MRDVKGDELQRLPAHPQLRFTFHVLRPQLQLVRRPISCTTTDMLTLLEFHKTLGASFGTVNGVEVVTHYGDKLAEHAVLCRGAGALDLSFRGRLCLTGTERARFLHGQVTNDINGLAVGEGCYAALVTAKGRMQSDLNIYRLADELLLDFEPGLNGKVSQRLEQFIVADDVQVVEVAPHYGLLSVQGPKAEEAVWGLEMFKALPAKPFNSVAVDDPILGELYLMNQPRFGTRGYDIFVPTGAMRAVADKLLASLKVLGGRACGWEALEIARIEAGVPRFDADMDETNLPLECGIERRAVSYTKGCYLGQEIINRVHTQGHVNKEVRGLRFADDLQSVPSKGDKLFHTGKEVGYITSAVWSPAFKASIALGYVRREANAPGTKLVVRTTAGERQATVTALA